MAPPEIGTPSRSFPLGGSQGTGEGSSQSLIIKSRGADTFYYITKISLFSKGGGLSREGRGSSSQSRITESRWIDTHYFI